MAEKERANICVENESDNESIDDLAFQRISEHLGEIPTLADERALQMRGICIRKMTRR